MYTVYQMLVAIVKALSMPCADWLSRPLPYDRLLRDSLAINALTFEKPVVAGPSSLRGYLTPN